MIEIIAIILQIFFITVLCYFPKKIINISSHTKIVLPISIIYLSFLLLFLSFISINLYYVNFILMVIFFINLFFIYKEENYKYFFKIFDIFA